MSGIFNAAIFNNAIFNTGGVAQVEPARSDGGARWPPLKPKRHPRRAKFRKLHPDEIARQQRMVQEYLDSLERKAQEPKQKKAPKFTPALARAAADAQLTTIVRTSAVLAQDRARAAEELRRRHLRLVLLLALD